MAIPPSNHILYVLLLRSPHLAPPDQPVIDNWSDLTERLLFAGDTDMTQGLCAERLKLTLGSSGQLLLGSKVPITRSFYK